MPSGRERNLVYVRGREAEMGELYARVSKALGDCRFECVCSDGTVRIGKVRGVLRDRMMVHVGDIVICSVRDFATTKVDIVHRYLEGDVPLGAMESA